jgi:hypothetical protein
VCDDDDDDYDDDDDDDNDDDEGSIIRSPCSISGSHAMKKVDDNGLFSHIYLI